MNYIKEIQLRVVIKKHSAIERLRNRPEFNVIQTTQARQVLIFDQITDCFERLGLKAPSVVDLEEKEKLEIIEEKLDYLRAEIETTAANYDEMVHISLFQQRQLFEREEQLKTKN